MEPATATVSSSITLHEAMAGLIWPALSRKSKKIFEEIEEAETKLEGPSALQTLYRKLDGCTIEDSVTARRLFLERHYLWKPDSSKRRTKVHDARIQTAIDDLAALHEKLQSYEKAFHEELDSANPCITICPSPTRQARFSAHSVALWARKKLEITVPAWEDWSKHDLFARDLEHEPWLKAAQDEAELHVLDALLSAVQRTQDGEIKEDPLWRQLQQSINSVSKESETVTIPKHNTKKVLKLHRDNPPLSSMKLEPYGSPKQACVQRVVAAASIYLAPEEFAAELRQTDPLKKTPLPALREIDVTRIDCVHPETAKEIVWRCIKKVIIASRVSPD